MTTLMQANRQWASRPDDERFTSLIDLNSHVTHQHERSRPKVISSRGLSLVPVSEDSRALQCVGPNGGAVNLTNWSFGQLCTKVSAPAGYLRDLPGAMAADCLNYGLTRGEPEDFGVLLYQNGGPAELRAVTGPNYGRIWNSTITQALVRNFGDGLTGKFRVPGEFGKAVEVTKANTTLYASDRDMFVFLADEENRIEVPNRRDGQSGEMARGFFVWNSEVGASTFGVATFLFDYVCSNRIVWGAQGFQEMKIKHTASAPARFIEEAKPALLSYANSSTAGIVAGIAEAKKARIGDEEAVQEFLAKRFTRAQVGAIKAAHMQDEQRPIETLWDAATGVTAYAREISYQDERVKLEREAGKILKLAA